VLFQGWRKLVITDCRSWFLRASF